MRCSVGGLLLLAALATLGCRARETAIPAKDIELAQRIERLVESFLTSDDDDKEGAALSDAKVIFERNGIPTIAKVGDAAAYGFVLVNGRAGPHAGGALRAARSPLSK
jgi:hypothetical protein